jgi:2-oxoisovalerate dehydrogenase E1 component
MATTKTDPKAAASERDSKKPGKTYEGLSREQLIEAYRHMYASRRVDDREILLKRQRRFSSRSLARAMKPSVWPRRLP